MKIQIKNDVDVNGLTPNAVYAVIGIDDIYYRVVNDSKDPILYKKNIFNIIDPYVPEHWLRRGYPDGEFYLDPPEFSEIGFFEDYFDGNQDAVNRYNEYLSLNGIPGSS